MMDGGYGDIEGAKPRAKKDAIDDEQLAVIIRQQEAAAYAFSQSEIASDRAKALDYYLGKKFGNEVEGRSEVISTDVFDTIEGMLPSLIEVFTASNKIGECEAFGPEDEEEAKQQTLAANHVLFKQNNAPLIFYTWFKDALLSKNGIVKFYYDDQKNEYRTEKYENLTQQEYIGLVESPNVEEVSASQHELYIGPQPIVVFDVEVKVYTRRGRIEVCNVVPENFYVTPRQTSVDLTNCEFCSHREPKTITDLIEMGFDEKELEDISTDGDMAETSSEAIARDIYSTRRSEEISDADKSMRQIWCSDAYIMIDADGDGVAELRRVFMAGNKVLLNETTDIIPFAVISPIIFPHQFHGISAADMTMDVQLYKSTILRQAMDSLYYANNPRMAVLENQANMDDVLTSRPAGIVRIKIPGAVTPLITPFVGKESFPMLEYWEGVKENRTGVTRYNQGLDADSLNKTAHGISQIMTAAMKRQELIARLFAETGVKTLMCGILHCIATSGMKAMIVRLTNGYVNIDPRQWKNQYDVTINVALGSGTKDRQIQLLNMLSAKQIELKQTGRGYMVSEENDYNLAAKLCEATGFKNPELFFTDPKIVPPQAKVPPPNPELIKLKADMQFKAADMKATTQAKQADMQNERAIEQMKAEVGAKTDIVIANIQREKDIAVAKIKAETDTKLKLADVIDSDEDRRQEAEIKVFDANREQGPIEAAAELKKTAQTMTEVMAQVMQNMQEMNRQMLEHIAQMMSADKVVKTAAKKDKSGRLTGTVKEYADGRTEEIPHSTIQ